MEKNGCFGSVVEFVVAEARHMRTLHTVQMRSGDG